MYISLDIKNEDAQIIMHWWNEIVVLVGTGFSEFKSLCIDCIQEEGRGNREMYTCKLTHIAHILMNDKIMMINIDNDVT